MIKLVMMDLILEDSSSNNNNNNIVMVEDLEDLVEVDLVVVDFLAEDSVVVDFLAEDSVVVVVFRLVVEVDSINKNLLLRRHLHSLLIRL
jgi:hypothetical protein